MKIGIDLGGSHIGIGIVDEKGYVIEKSEKRIVERDRKNIKSIIEKYITEKVKNIIEENEITQIGIAIPGTISDEKVIKSVNLGLKNYPIVKKLQEKINIPIKIANDCRCAALAENKYGALKKYSREVFITLGTGIGGAVIINDKVLDTGELPGCEFGHMIIQKNGIQCNCGKRGCFEAYSSIKRFKEKIAKEFCLDNLNNNYIKEFIINNLNDVRLRYIISQYIENLAIGISNLINIFEPEIIVFGGGFVDYSDILLEPLKQQILTTNLLFNKRDDIILKLAKLGNDAGIIGASLNDKTPIFNE